MVETISISFVSIVGFFAPSHCFTTIRNCSVWGAISSSIAVAKNASRVSLGRDPVSATQGANLVVTDTWASMGQEMEQEQRKIAFAPYQVNAELMSHAARDAIFMHCLPAYRGCEVSAEVLEDESISVVWDEAENRLHAQKALIEFLLNQ